MWKTQQAIDRGYNVAVANTFTQLWEMKPYFDLTPNVFVIRCKRIRYSLQTYSLFVANVFVIRCTGPFRTVHDVPDDVIKKMSDRFEDYEGETYL